MTFKRFDTLEHSSTDGQKMSHSSESPHNAHTGIRGDLTLKDSRKLRHSFFGESVRKIFGMLSSSIPNGHIL